MKNKAVIFMIAIAFIAIVAVLQIWGIYWAWNTLADQLRLPHINIWGSVAICFIIWTVFGTVRVSNKSDR